MKSYIYLKPGDNCDDAVPREEKPLKFLPAAAIIIHFLLAELLRDETKPFVSLLTRLLTHPCVICRAVCVIKDGKEAETLSTDEK